MNQNNQASHRTISSVSTRIDENQQLSLVLVVTHQNPSQFPATQNQLMPATMQTSDNSNVVNVAQLVAIPMARHQFKFERFMMTKPPVFEGSTALEDAESWIRTIEEKLTVVQCNDNEKVLYATHQLEGVALDWWEKFRATHQASRPSPSQSSPLFFVNSMQHQARVIKRNLIF